MLMKKIEAFELKCYIKNTYNMGIKRKTTGSLQDVNISENRLIDSSVQQKLRNCEHIKRYCGLEDIPPW